VLPALYWLYGEREPARNEAADAFEPTPAVAARLA
jgi:hypothetical protein